MNAQWPGGGASTATFSLYSDAGCTTQVGVDEIVSISGTSAATVLGVEVTETGFYYWTVEYSGDQYNEGFTTTCGQEVTQILAKDDTPRDDFVGDLAD